MFGFFVLSVIVAPFLILGAWLLELDDFAGRVVNLSVLLLIFGFIFFFHYLPIIKARKELNSIKNQLEEAEYRICADLDACWGKLKIVPVCSVNDSYLVIEPNEKIDFREYNSFFEI